MKIPLIFNIRKSRISPIIVRGLFVSGVILLGNVAAKVEAQTNYENAPLKFEITTKQRQFILGEPVFVNVKLDVPFRVVLPVLTQRVRCHARLPNGKDDGTIFPFVCGVTEYPCVEVKAGEPWRKDFNFVDEMPFNQIGKYSLDVSYNSTWYTDVTPADVYQGRILSNKVPIEVRKPTGVDAVVFKIFKSRWLLSSFNPSFCSSEDVSTLVKISKNYPKSTYAKYALFYLGEYYRRLDASNGEPKFVNPAKALYSKVLTDYPTFQLKKQAQLGLAEMKRHETSYRISKRWRQYLNN